MWAAGLLLGLLPALGHGLYDALNRVESARVYGNIDAYAYYFVDLLIGTPPQRVSVILDTGSGVMAFPCASCRHCGAHIDPAFDFARSSTAAWSKCDKDCRGRCDKGHCTYYQGYTEGSSISGFWFKDYVRLGDAIQHNPPVLSRMGCHQNENNLFYTQKANGILGVGPTARGGGRTLLQELFKDKAHVNPMIFSICLAEWGGRLVVGGFNATYHRGPLKYASLSLQTGYYGVGLEAMRINGVRVASRFGRTMIDSGTTYTYMGSQSFRGLRDGITSYCQAHGNCGASRKKDCWTLLPGTDGLGQFPDIEVVFSGSVTTRWVPKAYLSRSSKASRKWCFAFKDDGAAANTVLGASWMVHQEIIFDLRASRVGIASAECPEYYRRPAHPKNLSSGKLKLSAVESAAAKSFRTPASANSTSPSSEGSKPSPSPFTKAPTVRANASRASNTSFQRNASAPWRNATTPQSSVVKASEPPTATLAPKPLTKPNTTTRAPEPAIAVGTTTLAPKPLTKPNTTTRAPEPGIAVGTTTLAPKPPTKPNTTTPAPKPATKPSTTTRGPKPTTQPRTTTTLAPKPAATTMPRTVTTLAPKPAAIAVTTTLAPAKASTAAPPAKASKPAAVATTTTGAATQAEPEQASEPDEAPQPVLKPATTAKPAPAVVTTAAPAQGAGPAGAGDFASWVQRDVLRLAAVGLGALLALGLCARLACRLLRRREHRHVQLKDADDSGMPPQIVGSATEHSMIAGPETFVIGDDDDDECEALFEDPAFTFDFSRPADPRSPRQREDGAAGPLAGGSPGGERGQEQHASWPLGGDAGVGGPVFSGPAQASNGCGPLD